LIPKRILIFLPCWRKISYEMSDWNVSSFRRYNSGFVLLLYF